MHYYEKEFIYLEIKWETWIGKKLNYYFSNILHHEYKVITPNKREEYIWVTKIINDYTFEKYFMLLFSEYCIENMNILNDSSTVIESTKEMLYIIKFVHSKTCYNSNYTLEHIMYTFIFYFTLDLIRKKNKYVITQINNFIHKNMNKIRERRIIGAMCLNRIPGFDNNINSSIIQYLI
jgi:hypothetical protein